MFLGLRMNVGVDLEAMHAEFGAELMRGAVAALNDWRWLVWSSAKAVGCG